MYKISNTNRNFSAQCRNDNSILDISLQSCVVHHYICQNKNRSNVEQTVAFARNKILKPSHDE